MLLILNSLWIGGGQLISLLLKIASVSVLARMASVEFVGNFQFIMTLLGIMSIFTLPGIESSLVRAIARGEMFSGRDVVRSRLEWSIAGVIVIIVIGMYYIFIDWRFGVSLISISVLFPFVYVFDGWRSYWRGRGKFHRLVVGSVLLLFFQLMTLWCALWFFGDQLFLVMVIFVGITGLVNCLLWRRLEWHLQGSHTNEVISYGCMLTKTQIPLLLSRYIDKILIFLVAGPAQLAYYSVGVDISRTINVKVNEFIDLESPHIARDGIRFQRMWRVIITTLVVSVALYVSLPFVVPFLFSHRYIESVVLAQIVIVFLPCSVLSYMYRNHFLLHLKHERVLMWESWIFSFSRLILLILFYYVWGVVGLAVVIGAQSVFRLILLYALSRYMS